ncbi:MAG: hypothetical protein QOD74_1870 [Variibacter sp.]|jgi:hypothetical protein|nr:hypothetical protein [Variibacter sp.]
MMFLIRVAFWLTIVLILLPTGEKTPNPQAAQVGAVEAFSAASAAVSDMSSFCERQPGACVIGAQTASALGQKAQAGAKMVYEFFVEKSATTQSPAQSSVVNIDKNSQNTLTAADRAPAWRGPQPRPETAKRQGSSQG